MNDYLEFLNIKVIQESKPVTYKSLARSLGIHVNTAKQALYEFSTNHKNVFAVYCITGISIANDQFKIQLVKESELEESKNTYKQITGIHVYSVASFNPNDFSIFYTAYEDAPKLAIEDRVKCGILKNNHVTVKAVASNRRTDSKAPSKPAPAKPIVDSKPATKPEPKAKAETLKRKGTLNFGPAATKKQAAAAPVSTKSTAKADKPVSKPVVTNKKKDADHDQIAKRMAKTSIKASDIFSDDEEEEKEEQEDQEPKSIAESKDEDEDIDMEDTVESKEPEAKPQADNKPSPATPTKSRKKVLKKKTTRNARGFLVTEEVWEFESGDEEETSDNVQPKAKEPTPANLPSTKNNTKKPAKPGKQANLFSFFKKA